MIKGKVYRVVAPDPNDPPEGVRIIDETGEDYPYPREWFGELELPQDYINALKAKAA